MVSDLDKVGMQIDIDGKGVMDVFNPYIPVTYVQYKFNLPDANSWNYGQFLDFDIPADIQNPYFWMYDPDDWEKGYFYNFLHLGGTTWRVTLWGRFVYTMDSNGNVIGRRPMWTEPIMKSTMQVVVGGYRG